MSMKKKVEANRRNAKKSTGPTSALGKKHSSGNAVTHGCFAMRMLPGEDAKLYFRLLESLCDELQPRGPLEEAYVHEIANDYWRLGRLHRGENDILSELVCRAAYARQEEDEIPDNSEGDGTPDNESGDLDVASEDVDKAMSTCITEYDQVEIYDRVQENRQRLLRSIKRKLAMLFTLQQRRVVEVLPTKRASELPSDRQGDRSVRPAAQMDLI